MASEEICGLIKVTLLAACWGLYHLVVPSVKTGDKQEGRAGRCRPLMERDTLRDRLSPSEPRNETAQTLRPRSQGGCGNRGLQASSGLMLSWSWGSGPGQEGKKSLSEGNGLKTDSLPSGKATQTGHVRQTHVHT